MERGRGRERSTSVVIYNKSHPETRSVPGDVPGPSSGCHTHEGPQPQRGDRGAAGPCHSGRWQLWV